ncbi:hypothetical protein [Shewanella glacialimarina]|uniref:hypothetical protein n=1 Tax=Shewanella glacialimarina TaxID=2590884 RepID=UPI001CF82686|nr:hypothetical protein [Shewanella glacialimarina]UCX04449.1 hypothetical protein FJ709_08015 [Shewanella glacialimarina]
MSLLESFNFLLAQRQIILSSFQCEPKNLADNTQSLLITLKMLLQEGGVSHPLLNAKTSTDFISALESEAEYSIENQLVIMQLLLHLHYKHAPDKQVDVFQKLFESSTVNSDKYLPYLALIASQQNIDKIPFRTTNKMSVQIHQYLLFCLYRGKRLKRKGAAEVLEVSMTPMTTLYIEMLMETPKEPLALYTDFVELALCNNVLFDIFITSLEEPIFTQLVNLMSQDNSMRARVIELMGYSGFSKFVPFLARAMQQPAQTLAAFKALRTILGPELDHAVPYQWQFEDDQSKRCEYLQFYSAKLLNRWLLLAPKMLNVRMINGIEVNIETIDKIISHSSPVHQQVARLHKLRLQGVISQPASKQFKLAS